MTTKTTKTTKTTEAISPEVPKTPAMRVQDSFEWLRDDLARKNSTLLAAWGIFLDTYEAAHNAAALAHNAALDANTAALAPAVLKYCVPVLDVTGAAGVVSITQNLAYCELQDEVEEKLLDVQLNGALPGDVAEYLKARNRLDIVLWRRR